MNLYEVGQRFMVLTMSLLFLLALSACSSGSDSGNVGGAPAASTLTGSVTGKVLSATTSAPVGGATVSSGSFSATSQGDGTFSITTAIGDRVVIRTEAAGFAETFDLATVTAGKTTVIGVQLLPTGVTIPVIVANGDTVSVPNSPAQVILPPAGLMPKTGGPASSTVNVSLTPINPAIDTNLMPGDFNGVSAGGGSPVPIESFGAVLIDIRDNAGTRYNLAPGKISTIRIPLGTKSSAPPATIPLFFFDETTGLWREEGTATLAGTPPNQYYEGTVTHFSAWNADDVLLRTFVTGCVNDTNGNPAVGVTVQSNGIDYTGTASGITDASGTFRVGVRRGSSASISVIEWNLFSIGLVTLSNTVTVPSSDVDRTLPDCLVLLPGAVRITTQALPSGTVGALYATTVAALNGIQPYSWDVTIGALPAGLSLNPSTGQISGMPTTVGVSTFTLRVRDNSIPQQSATKQLTISITQVSSGGGSGTLTVTGPGAPASVGSSFVADGQFTSQNVFGNSASVSWLENQNSHVELVTLSFDLTTNQVVSIIFASSDSNIGTAWLCFNFPIPIPNYVPCSGTTVNRSAGTLTLASQALIDNVNSNPGITVNGTLNFTPF